MFERRLLLAMVGLLLLCLASLLWFFWPNLSASRRREGRQNILALIGESKQRFSLIDSTYLENATLLWGDTRFVVEYILANPDFTSYHLLFLLRREAPRAYRKIPNSVRAAVLCSALSNVGTLNDWGHLHAGESRPTEVVQELIGTGETPLKYLVPILDDRKPAPHFGSADATASYVYKYRRCDYAYRYICLILGRTPEFHEDPSERDKNIKTLKAHLKATME